MLFLIPLSATMVLWVALTPKNREDHGFEPRYRRIHSGSDDHLKWQFSVIGSYPQWQTKEPQGH